MERRELRGNRYRLDAAKVAHKLVALHVAEDKSIEAKRRIAHVPQAQWLSGSVSGSSRRADVGEEGSWRMDGSEGRVLGR